MGCSLPDFTDSEFRNFAKFRTTYLENYVQNQCVRYMFLSKLCKTIHIYYFFNFHGLKWSKDIWLTKDRVLFGLKTKFLWLHSCSIFPLFLGWSLHLPTDGFLRSLWNVSVMVHVFPNNCHLLDFRGQKNVQLYRTYGRIQNPNLLADLLGFCSPCLYGLFVLILFHQVHPYHVWQGLCLSSMG